MAAIGSGDADVGRRWGCCGFWRVFRDRALLGSARVFFTRGGHNSWLRTISYIVCESICNTMREASAFRPRVILLLLLQQRTKGTIYTSIYLYIDGCRFPVRYSVFGLIEGFFFKHLLYHSTLDLHHAQ